MLKLGGYCKRSHLLTQTNLYIPAKGWPACRDCHNVIEKKNACADCGQPIRRTNIRCNACKGKLYIGNQWGLLSGGKASGHWKGDDVWYGGLHDWLRREFGKATHCENPICPGKSKRYEWSNISGEYKRERNDFRMLCASCHRKQDIAFRKASEKPLKNKMTEQIARKSQAIQAEFGGEENV